jgi:hypothetical protein
LFRDRSLVRFLPLTFPGFSVLFGRFLQTNFDILYPVRFLPS